MLFNKQVVTKLILIVLTGRIEMDAITAKLGWKKPLVSSIVVLFMLMAGMSTSIACSCKRSDVHCKSKTAHSVGVKLDGCCSSDYKTFKPC